jgi:hypothetical protein
MTNPKTAQLREELLAAQKTIRRLKWETIALKTKADFYEVGMGLNSDIILRHELHIKDLNEYIKKLESMLGPQAKLIGGGDVRISGSNEQAKKQWNAVRKGS